MCIGRLLNHLVGAGKQSTRHRQTERASSFDVDEKMKPPRLLYGKFARLGILQDLVHIARRPPKQVFIIWRIGNESAGLDVLAEWIGGGQLVLDRELRDAVALACQKSVRRHQESVRPIFC